MQFPSIQCSAQLSIGVNPIGSFNTEAEHLEKKDGFSNTEYNIKDNYISDNHSPTIANANKAIISTGINEQHNDRTSKELILAKSESEITPRSCLLFGQGGLDKVQDDHVNDMSIPSLPDLALDKNETENAKTTSSILESRIARTPTFHSNFQKTDSTVSYSRIATAEYVFKSLVSSKGLDDHAKLYNNGETMHCRVKYITTSRTDRFAPKTVSRSNIVYPTEPSPLVAFMKSLQNEKFTIKLISYGAFVSLAQMSANCPAGLEIVYEFLAPEDKNDNAIDNKSKRRDKLTVRLNVISPDYFQNAMRNFRLITYELTYTRIFPSNCRMFIDLPVNKHGFIRRQDDKQTKEKHT